MYCMKCGRDTDEDHVFCESCRENMLLHPVDPGTAIHLPNRTVRKKAAPKKRPIPPEEQIQNLRRSLRRTRGFALILLVILIMTAVIFVHQLTGAEAPLIGQNYTIHIERTSD